MTLPKLYPIVDTSYCERYGFTPVELAGAFVDAGVQILQFRHKGSFTRGVFAQAEALAQLCRTAGVRFVLNDRADIAALLESDLHLGQDDLTPFQARTVLPHGAIGYSTHNEEQFQTASHNPEVDYLAVGPIFATSSKLNPDPVVGLSRLNSIAATKRHPLVAIGGITLDNAAQVYEAGADSIALIGALIPTTSEPTLDAVRKRTAEWLVV